MEQVLIAHRVNQVITKTVQAVRAVLREALVRAEQQNPFNVLLATMRQQDLQHVLAAGRENHPQKAHHHVLIATRAVQHARAAQTAAAAVKTAITNKEVPVLPALQVTIAKTTQAPSAPKTTIAPQAQLIRHLVLMV